MADVVDRATRSRMMAGIKGQHTQPEVTLRRALHARGLRFRLHERKLPGAPDIVLPRWNSVIFVHGCFWHRHAGCGLTAAPSTRPDFWQAKFEANVARDQRNQSALRQAGRRIVVVWECALRNQGAPTVAEMVAKWLEGAEPVLTIPAKL